MKTKMMALFLALLLPVSVMANCEVSEAMKQAAAGRYDTEKKLAEDMAKYQRQIASAEKSCLNKYRDISMTSQVGMPSLTSILQGVVKGLESQACQVIDGAISQTTGLVGNQAVLPGGVGYVNTGVIYGNVGTVATTAPATAPVTIKDTSGAASGSILNTIKGWFF